MSISFGGGGKQTSRAKLPAPSAAETQAATAQAQALQAFQAQQAQHEALTRSLYGGTQQLAAQNLQTGLGQGGMTLSPQQQAYIEQMFAGPRQAALTLLHQQGEADAARRGMTLSDSPGALPYAQAQALLLQHLSGQQANAALNYGQQAFGNNMQFGQFAENLAQQAQQNRFALATGQGQLNQNLFGQRLAAAPQMANFQRAPTYGLDLGSIGRGLQGLTQAVGTSGSPAQGIYGQPGYSPAVPASGVRSWFS